MEETKKQIIKIIAGITILTILAYLTLDKIEQIQTKQFERNLHTEVLPPITKEIIIQKETINNTIILQKQYQEIEKSKQCIGFDITKANNWNSDGSSMLPTFREGNKLLVKEYETEKGLAKGEIVISKEWNGDLTIHRVTRTQQECYVTQGDNNEYEDDCKTYDKIKSVVCGTIYT